jgi:DNA-binding NarL/FixJ family response regulator
VIRTAVAARSPLDRAGIAALLHDAKGVVVVEDEADADVRVEAGEAHGSSPLPTVSLVDDPAAAWALRAHANDDDGGFAILARDASGDEIVAAVHAVAAGMAVVQARTLRETASAPAAERSTERLSPRERDVLGELARGAPNKQIAARLGISEHTVKFHIGSIFAKLGVASRTEAVTRGVRLGLIML